MGAGQYRHRCRLYRNEPIRDPIGGDTDHWVQVRPFWGDVRAVSGRNWLAAAQHQAEVTVEIHCRPLAALAGMRVEHDSITYQIEQPLLDRGRHRLRLMCKTVKPDG